MSVELIIDLLGRIGAAVLLIAYGLVSARKLAGDSVSYQLMNLLGSAFLILNSSYYGAFPSVSVNVVWIAIAAISLIRIAARARQTTR